MKLTPNKLKRLLDIIELNHIMFGIRVVGERPMASDDFNLLRKYGINIDDLRQNYPHILRSFHWGRLSEALKNKASSVSEKDFMEYLKRGQYIPLNDSEKNALNYVENKSFAHIKNLGERVKQTVSGIVIENDPELRAFRERVIKEEAKRAIIERQSVSSMVSEIGHRTGDWERDLGRIAETELNNAFQEGKAEQIKREKGEDALVYKDVYHGACRHCIKAYLTRGLGSEPRVFKLSELMQNGTNMGRKTKDWKPVLESMHPFCRCTLRSLSKGYVWDQDKNSFVPPKYERNKYGEEGTVKITVGDKVIIV